MVALGVGQIIGGVAIGLLLDKIGPKKCSLLNVALVILVSGLTIGYVYKNEYSFFAYVVTFFWGVLDSSINIQIY